MISSNRSNDHEEPAGALTTATTADEQTLLWMIEGIRWADIEAAIKVSYPGADPAKLAAAAFQHFEQTAQADALVLRGWCLEAYRELYRRSVEIGDFPAAMRAVKELMAYSLKCLPNTLNAEPTT